MSGVTRHLIGSMSSHLSDWATSNSVSVAWENRPFTTPSPNSDTKWARPTFFPAETRQASVGDAGLNQVGGILLVSLFGAKGKNSGALNTLADSLITHFKRGTTTAAVSGYQARINNVWRDAALPVDDRAKADDWFHIPVRIRFFQHVTNI